MTRAIIKWATHSIATWGVIGFYAALFLYLQGCSLKNVTWKDAAWFAAGAAGSYVVHEGAHYAVAKSKGYDMRFTGWNRFSYSEDGIPVQADTGLRMAGLLANAASSETILMFSKEKTRHPFWEGLLFANTIEEITYPTLRGNKLDFAEGKVNHRDGWKYGFVAHGASVAARAYGPKVRRWWIGANPLEGGAAMSLVWRW